MFMENQIFDGRYYRWQISEWAREIKNEYPFLRLVKEDSMIQIMEGLPDDKKMIMAKALVNRGISEEYLEKLGGKHTEEEKRFIDYFIEEGRRLRHIFACQTSLEDCNYHIKIDKKKFKQYIIEALSPILGSDIENQGGGVFVFCMPVGAWKIYTGIDIGGSRHNLSYEHAIESAGGKRIAHNISVLAWLGICQTQWQYLSNDDLKPTAESLSILCKHFMIAVPKLLEGLTPD